MHLTDKLNPSCQKKILTLDGGGIRGIITVEILAKIEQELKIKENNPNLRLSEYFDFVAGTSTGALIGACISMGMSVEQIRKFYLDSGKKMFDRRFWIPKIGKLIGYEYSDEPLVKILKDVVGKNTTLGSEKLKTLFLLVMHNAETDSPWVISNNPKAKYNDLDKYGKNSNLNILLWQLLRASTAAPTFFPPEKIDISGREYLFLDGAITPYNNPAFQAYLMSTLNAYNMNWKKGEDKILVVSVGTGQVTLKQPFLKLFKMNIFHHAQKVPAHLLNSMEYQQDLLCRVFGNCIVGHELDSEIEDLKGVISRGAVDKKLFSYIRYNPKLDKEGLAKLDLTHLDPKKIAKLDAVDNIKMMQEVGVAVSKHEVKREHFNGF